MFENHLMVDKTVLSEWYKKEFYQENPFFVGMHIGLMVIYMALAALAFVSRWLLPTWLAVAEIVLFLLLASIFFANLLLRCHMQVHQLLKEDGGRRFPAHVGTVFYTGFAMPAGEEPGQDPAGKMLACVSRAAALQEEFNSMLAQLSGRPDETAGRVEELRMQLTLLQKQLEDLSAEAKAASGTQYSYSRVSSYTQTKSLHVLHFGQAAVLVAKDGFTLGSDGEFCAFIAPQLARVAASAQDEKVQRGLEKALAKYFPEKGRRKEEGNGSD